MSEPVHLYCLGATKAGTSWFYRALHDHPECHLRAVKELHYWDTFAPEAQERQVAAYRARLAGFEAERAAAEAAGIGWKAANMRRRIADMSGLIAVLEGAREGDRGYRDWMRDGLGEKRLVADMTPAYALLPETRLLRMARVSGLTRFVYLIRDPLARLWSHVRMQAVRQRQPGQEVGQKANATLWRILHRGQETHILERGDYPAIVARLRAALPEGALRVEFIERLVTAEGWRAMCGWLGLSDHPAEGEARPHEGPAVALREDLAAKAVGFLKEHYDWAAREMGPLPQEWQDTLARARA